VTSSQGGDQRVTPEIVSRHARARPQGRPSGTFQPGRPAAKGIPARARAESQFPSLRLRKPPPLGGEGSSRHNAL